MATFSYVQTDTSATYNQGCATGTDGITTAGRQAPEGGTAGTVEVSVAPDSGLSDAERMCLVFDTNDPPGVSEWASGNYVVPVNVTTQDAGTLLLNCYICDYDGSTYATVASQTGNPSTRGATGIHTFTCNRGTAYTPQSEANSRVYVVISLGNNDLHGASTCGVTPNQTMTTPIVVPTATDVPHLIVNASAMI